MVLEQRSRLNIAIFDRQGEQQQVELAFQQFHHQCVGLGLMDMQVKPGIAGLDERQKRWQGEGARDGITPSLSGPDNPSPVLQAQS